MWSEVELATCQFLFGNIFFGSPIPPPTDPWFLEGCVSETVGFIMELVGLAPHARPLKASVGLTCNLFVDMFSLLVCLSVRLLVCLSLVSLHPFVYPFSASTCSCWSVGLSCCFPVHRSVWVNVCQDGSAILRAYF